MRKIIALLFIAASSAVVFSCKERIDYVTPDWVSITKPEEGVTMILGSETEMVEFAWEKKEGATYRIDFDKTHKFENPVSFDLDTASHFSISCGKILEVLRTLDPEFLGKQTFYWNLTETTPARTQNCWRFFNAVYAAGSFTDPRDGVEYNTIKYDLDEYTTYEFMTDNLKATVYSDNGLLEDGARYLVGGPLEDDSEFVGAVGCYYSWHDAVRMTWEEAKEAYNNKVQVQGICPDGWHVPSYDEWDNMQNYFGGYEKGALNILTKEYWPGPKGITNDMKFNLLPAGRYNTEDAETVVFSGERCTLWSSTPVLAFSAYSWGNFFESDQVGLAMVIDIQYDKEGIYRYYHGTGDNGADKCFCSIRCMRNYSVD